jgi:hypothetical protein
MRDRKQILCWIVFCPRKFFDEFSGCHGNYVNKSIICYFIIAIKLKGRHIL